MTFVLDDTWPVARKEHVCSQCHRTILPGEKYNRQRNVFDGHAYTFKSCSHCHWLAMACIDYFAWNDEGFNLADTDIRDMAIEDGRIHVLRAAAWYLRRWTRMDGTLVEVPVHPPVAS